MYCVYDSKTGARLSFEYTSREEAQHVADSIRYCRFETLVMPVSWEAKMLAA